MSYDSSNLTTPDIKWLGVRPAACRCCCWGAACCLTLLQLLPPSSFGCVLQLLQLLRRPHSKRAWIQGLGVRLCWMLPLLLVFPSALSMH